MALSSEINYTRPISPEELAHTAATILQSKGADVPPTLLEQAKAMLTPPPRVTYYLPIFLARDVTKRSSPTTVPTANLPQPLPKTTSS